MLLRSRFASVLVRQAACALAVFCGAAVTLVGMTAPDGLTMPMWTGSGLAIAALWLGGRRLWPAVALGLFLATLVTGRVILTPSVTLGGVLEGLLGVYLLRRVGFRSSLGRVRDALALMTLLTTLGPLLTAGVTFAAAFAFSGPLAPPDVPSAVPPGMSVFDFALLAARFTWIGDAVGAILVAPTILVWAGILRRRPRLRRARLAEAVALAVLLLVSSLFAFGVVPAGPVKREYVIFPALFWAALRFGPAGATLSVLGAQSALIWLTLHNLGPFASGTAAIDPGMVQTFVIVAAASVLLLATTSTERQRASEEAGRLRAETRFGKLIEHISDMVVVVDGQGQVTYCNAALGRTLGLSEAELADLVQPRVVQPDLPPMSGLFTLVHPQDRDFARGRAEMVDREGQVTTREVRLRHADGSWRTLEVTTQYLLEQPTIGGVIVTARDVTERKQAEDALHRLALYDALTGLPNRMLLQDRLDQVLETAARQQSAFALVMCDLDRFKEVNDTLGHHAGDALLRQVAARLQACTRRSDTIARLGGDEFALLLPTVGDPETALEVVRGFVAALDAPFTIEGTPIGIAASAGIALYPSHGQDTTSLLRAADIAMYAAKREHLGAVCYAPDQASASSAELALFSELRTAIGAGELVLHYQPKIALASGATEAVEALVRWQHPRRGLLAPDAFIPLAERSGLMSALTRWVAEAALSQQREWQAVGLRVAMAINLSPSTLADPELPRDIVRLVGAYGVRPSDFIVEVTETAIMSDHARARAALGALREAGIRISVDDFGAGQSSLAYLKTLPLDELKIDRAFVQDMTSSSQDTAIVRTVIELGHRLGLRVTAEGVEDPAALEALASLGCDLAQGYWMSHPLPEQHLRTWVAARDGDPRDSALDLDAAA